MKNATWVRLTALALTVALVGAVSPAVADELEPSPDPATLILTAPGPLTLPDGDGVRDITAVTLSADIATDATIEVLAADGATILRELDAVTITDTLAFAFAVPVTGLPAGELYLRATPTAGDPVQVPLLVGSGDPTTVTLALSRSTIYTWAKSTTRTTVATVSAVDETGLTIPFAGTVTAKVGVKSQSVAVASKDANPAKATISSSKLAAGKATVTARVTGTAATKTSTAASLTVKNVAVSSTKLTASATTVYPTKDGYKDSVTLKVSSKTTTGGAVPVTGTVKITSKGKTVASWKLSSSKAWSKTWNGKVKGKVLPGTYTVSVSIKGPEGAAKVASKKITVKKGKLVTKTTKTTVTRKSLLTDQLTISGVSLYAGTRSVPKAVVKSIAYGAPKVRVSADVTRVSGDVAWGYGIADTEVGKVAEITKRGVSSPGWLKLPKSARKIDVILVTGESSSVTIKTFTIEYTYKVLSTK